MDHISSVILLNLFRLYILFLKIPFSFLYLITTAKSNEVEKYKTALSEENSMKHELEQQLTHLNERIVTLENEAEALKQAKSMLETEANANQEQLSRTLTQLRTELSNKAEEMNMLKEQFDVVLANKDGKYF